MSVYSLGNVRPIRTSCNQIMALCLLFLRVVVLPSIRRVVVSTLSSGFCFPSSSVNNNLSRSPVPDNDSTTGDNKGIGLLKDNKGIGTAFSTAF
jgi:hypothetical protein